MANERQSVVEKFDSASWVHKTQPGGHRSAQPKPPPKNRLPFPVLVLATRAPAAVSHLPTSVQFPSPPRSIARSDWHTARFALRGDQSLAGRDLSGRRESALLYALTWRCQPTASAPAVPAAAAAAAAAQTQNRQLQPPRTAEAGSANAHLRGRRAGLLLLLLLRASGRGLRRG